jgi:hypothetical protein
MLNSESVAEQSSSYRQGLVLGLTMAEVILLIVFALLIALAVGVLIGYLHLERCVQGLKLAVLLWAGFAFPLGLMANMFSDKKITVFYIDAGYQLVYLLVMGSILTVWH